MIAVDKKVDLGNTQLYQKPPGCHSVNSLTPGQT